MRVTSLIALLALAAVAVLAFLFRGAIFERMDSSHQWSSGFKPAETPAEAMEKFREAIQMRKYKWAATYCTKDYADMLVKTNEAASSLGEVIDHINNYMKDKGLQRDKTIFLLHRLDAFPKNFKVQGSPKETAPGKTAAGVFVWEPIPLSNPAGINLATEASSLDARMFATVLAPLSVVPVNTIELVKEGDAWKLKIVPSAGMVESVRYYNDHWKTYYTTLNDFRTYMTNGRYDSPQSFENEVVEALRKANPK